MATILAHKKPKRKVKKPANELADNDDPVLESDQYRGVYNPEQINSTEDQKYQSDNEDEFADFEAEVKAAEAQQKAKELEKQADHAFADLDNQDNHFDENLSNGGINGVGDPNAEPLGAGMASLQPKKKKKRKRKSSNDNGIPLVANADHDINGQHFEDPNGEFQQEFDNEEIKQDGILETDGSQLTTNRRNKRRMRRKKPSGTNQLEMGAQPELHNEGQDQENEHFNNFADPVEKNDLVDENEEDNPSDNYKYKNKALLDPDVSNVDDKNDQNVSDEPDFAQRLLQIQGQSDEEEDRNDDPVIQNESMNGLEKRSIGSEQEAEASQHEEVDNGSNEAVGRTGPNPTVAVDDNEVSIDHEAIESLHEMFPNIDKDTILEFHKMQGGNIEKTFELLREQANIADGDVPIDYEDDQNAQGVSPEDVEFNMLAGNALGGNMVDPNHISAEERKMIEKALRESEAQERALRGAPSAAAHHGRNLHSHAHQAVGRVHEEVGSQQEMLVSGARDAAGRALGTDKKAEKVPKNKGNKCCNIF